MRLIKTIIKWEMLSKYLLWFNERKKLLNIWDCTARKLMCFFSSLFLVPRVSIDGSPHEILTLVVCLSGLVVGTIFVIIIILMLNRKNDAESNTVQLNKVPVSTKIDIEPSTATKSSTNRSKIRIFTIFGSTKQSFDLNWI